MTTITLQEVAKHNKNGDLWLAIRGKVYNVSAFLGEHPGGEEVLRDVAGKEATKDFDDVGHSDEAARMMEKYYVGNLDGGYIPPPSNKTNPPSTPRKTEEANYKAIIVPLVLLIIAYLAYSSFGSQ